MIKSISLGIKFDSEKGCISINNLRFIRNLYNYFLLMSKHLNEQIFFQEKVESELNNIIGKENQCPESIPYLKKGDSNLYLEQFLEKNSIIIDEEPIQIELDKKDESAQLQDDQSYSLEMKGITPSSFHNFQKHLTVCLKNAIQISYSQKDSEDSQILGAKLWKIFKQSKVSTKKILHYILCEKNEHKITEQGMKTYGLSKLNEQYGQKKMRQARIYLANETLKQIKNGKIDEYLNSKKLKDKERFKKYVEIFVQQLQKGYLRKRLPKDKVMLLIRA